MKSSLINRRSLLKFAGSAGLISTVPWCSLYGGANDVAHPVRTDGRIALVFHEATEVLICGSTLFAIELALQTAKAGKRTVLAMERVNPLFEHIACLQSWCPADAIPELLRSVCSNSKTSTTIAGRCYYNLSSISKINSATLVCVFVIMLRSLVRWGRPMVGSWEPCSVVRPDCLPLKLAWSSTRLPKPRWLVLLAHKRPHNAVHGDTIM